MSVLEHAILIATEAHKGQKDKAGQPYILHSLRVMIALETDEERIVGVLHDVLEDTDVTENDLRGAGYSEVVIEGIKSVTRLQSETYKEFILRAKENEIGCKVKMADLLDNLDVRRLKQISAEDHKRMWKYQKAYQALTSNSEVNGDW